MTFTYYGTPLEKVSDEVRELMGDTRAETSVVSDETIAYALSRSNGNVYRACAIICNALAIRFAKDADIRVSTYATDRRTVSDKYREMAKSFSRKATSVGSFLMPALKQSTKNESTQDSDIVQPSFYRGLHDYAEGPDKEDSN